MTDPRDFESNDDYQDALIAERHAAYHGGSMEEMTLEPNYEVLSEWFAIGLSQHGFDLNAREPVISLIEQIRYLTLTDKDAVQRVIDRLAR